MKSYDGIKFYMCDDENQTQYLLTELSDEYYQVTWGKTFVVTLSHDDTKRHFAQGYWIELDNPKNMLKKRLKNEDV